MKTVLFTLPALALLALGAGAPLGDGSVWAQGRGRSGKQGKGSRPAKQEVQAKTVQAMESFDLLEFESAKKQLSEALELARKNELENQPIAARVYLNLGIVEFAGLKDPDAAREAFAEAVAIDPSIEIGVAYRTDAMAELLEAVKKGGSGPLLPLEEDDEASTDCAALEGVQHGVVDQGVIGRTQPISVRVGDPIGAEQVLLFYRAAGAEKYVRKAMRRGDRCTYEAAIPAAAMRGAAVHYFVVAMSGGQVVATRGSKDSPNIITLDGAGTGGGGGRREGDVSRGAGEPEEPPGEKKTAFIALAAGTGGGYISGGVTEVVGSDVGCCFAPALLHLFPEVGYYVTRRLSVSAAFRMGFALGANTPGHATAAPAGLLRVRYALARSGSGVHVSAAAGGGIIRHTVKVEEAEPGQDTDTTASGPFMVGAGLAYILPLTGAMQLLAEANGLAAFPAGIKEVGSCPGSGCVRPHFGTQIDLNLGVQFAF